MGDLSLSTIAILIFDIIVITSVLFNLGYFWELNLLPSHLMLSFIDIVMSALVWIPIATVLAITEVFLCTIIFTKLNAFTSGSRDKTLCRFKLFFWISSILLFLILIYNFFYSQFRIINLLAVPLLIIYTWLLLSLEWLFKFVRDKNFSRTTRLFVCLVTVMLPLISFVPYTIGLLLGSYDLQQSNQNATITLKSDKKIPIILLRTLEKGILLKTPEGKTFEFMPWEVIEKIDLTVMTPSEINDSQAKKINK